MDNTDTSHETELVPSIEHVERTSTTEEMGESFDCSPANSNLLVEIEEKTNRKSLFTEILEATRGSGESSTAGDLVIPAGNVNAIVGEVAGVSAEAVADTSTDPWKSNLAAASALEEDGNDATTSTGASSRDSMTETQRAALMARDAAEAAKTAAASGRVLVDILQRSMQLIESRMSAATERTVAIGVSDDEALIREAQYHHTIVSKCEAALEVLSRKVRRIKVSIRECESAATTAVECAAQADEVTDEESASGQSSRFNACYRKSQTEAAIVVLYQKEFTALWTIKRIWEDPSHDHASDSSGREEYTQECENQERKTRIAHGVAFLVGICVLAMSAFFNKNSDSFLAIVIIGTMITLWTTFYWINHFYSRFKSKRDEAETTAAVEPTEQMPDFLVTVNQRLDFVDRFLRKRNMIPRSDVEESDCGSSSETLRAEDVSS